MSAQPNRLASGGVIDRSTALQFYFDGHTYEGHPGDTLASALLANGEVLLGRSFKYHRPRGLVASGSEEPNALVELRSGARREANTKATVAEIYDGLEAHSQNRWPSLRLDALSVNSLLAPVFVAGFYYKTFMWPASFWEKLYEPMIRRAAGLGRAADTSDPDSYEKSSAFCDYLVVGGGPAGLMAALSAARSGARVILADENAHFGGRAIDDGAGIGEQSAIAWAQSAVKELASHADVRLMPRTTIFGAYDGKTYGGIERVSDHKMQPAPGEPRQRLWRIVAKQTIIATGATERPIVFAGNDKPGVMLAGAVRTYINRYGVTPGRRAIVFTNNDYAASTVTALVRAGVEVAALIDSRATPTAAVSEIARATGVRLFSGAVIESCRGRLQVKSAKIRTADGGTINLECDFVAMSGGWNPNIQLTTHLGQKPVWNAALNTFVAGSLREGCSIVGAASGAFGLAQALKTGAAAGQPAASTQALSIPSAIDESSAGEPLWQVTGGKGKAFVDFQNDVAVGDIELAHREGFSAVEHMKRYTTLGMATDQGRTANVNALAIMAGLTGKTIPQTGITSARPPYTPVAIGAFGGHHRGKEFKATRLPPSYAWSKEQGAVFVETGLWLRPAYYPRPGEKDWLETVIREVNTVRSAVGICDVSTLGKIDVQGPDAGAFLDRLYMNGMKTIAVGKARYGCMLRDDGIMMDDGTVARLGEQHYFVTTTTANAVKVFQHMELCQQWFWPDLDCQMISATEQWAQYAVAGPKSRDLLRKIVDPEHDISDATYPYMQCGEVTVCGGIKARLYRLSFSGERAFEIGVPARYGDALLRRLMTEGEEFGVCAYGSEALGVMRIEKGHISGPELNGTTTARDCGLGGMMSSKKDFIGRVLAQRPGLTDPNRPALVGLKPIDRAARLRASAHFLKPGADAKAQNDEGYLTSAAYSPTLGHWIGLGLLKNGPQRHGEQVRAYDPVRNGDTLCEVVSPIFVDPEGAKLRG